MKIKVELREGEKELDMPANFTGEDLLKRLKFSPDAVLIVVDGKPVPYKEKIKGKKIRIIRVASGG